LRVKSFFNGETLRFVITFVLICSAAHLAHADIIVAAVGPLSGASASLGQDLVRGASQAITDINARGGISGERLVLETADDECDNRKAETVAQELVAKHVNVVIGHYCSNPALAAARIYERAQIAMIAPSASLPSLTEAGLTNVLRIASRDDAQGDFAAARIAQDYPSGVVAVLNDGTPPNVALANRFTSNLGKAPALTLSFKPDAPDFDALQTQLTERKIDVIYFACNAADAGRIAAGFQNKVVLFGSDGLLVDQYWEKAAEAGTATHVSFTFDPQSAPEAKPIIAIMKAQGIEANGAVLPAYAAVELYAAAAIATGAKSGRAIGEYLHSGKTIATAIGGLSFDSKGDVQPQRFTWYQWSNGTYKAESHDY
jgi:branched-chain amino acid transport system substrate-binding protein